VPHRSDRAGSNPIAHVRHISLEGIEEHAAVIPAVWDTIERRDAALVTRHYRSLHFRSASVYFGRVANRVGSREVKMLYLFEDSHSTPSDENFGAALLRCRWNRKYSISCTILSRHRDHVVSRD
jgi:hypothetical protein